VSRRRTDPWTAHVGTRPEDADGQSPAG
jgi:hypothetical protein